jgi:ParB family chromosome partitioning protein
MTQMKGGLGRGLSSLIPPKQSVVNTDAERRASNPDLELVANSSILQLPISSIETNAYQPRTHFDERALHELADSIEQHGLLEPVIVTKKGDRYELIAGERRLRAHILLKKPTIAAILRTASELERLQLALIENIQREDLHPIERAMSYAQLSDEFGLTQEDAARRLGIARSTFANVVRYLELPEEIQHALGERRITEGHAKILLGLPSAVEQKQLFKQMTSGAAMSVRELEEIVAIQKGQGSRRKPAGSKSRDIADIEEALQKKLGTKVGIRTRGKGRFQIVIDAYASDDLKRLVKQLLA